MSDRLTTLLCSDESVYFTDFLTIRECYVLSWMNTAYKDFFQTLMQTKIDTLLQATLREYLGDKTETFLALLHESGAVLSGSFVLQTILQETWGLKPGDIDVFVAVGTQDVKKKRIYAYPDYTTIEEFLFYHCRKWETYCQDPEEQCRRYGDGFNDIANVRDYLIDATATQTPFSAIYEALNQKKAHTVKTLLRSIPGPSRYTAWSTVRETEFFAKKDVVTEDFRYRCSSCVAWRKPRIDADGVVSVPGAVRFQVIQKSCLPEHLIDNIYHYFDFDFCKVVCHVDENGRFRAQAKDWSSVFTKKCTFPSKLPYENRALPSTIQRYFKYGKRGFAFMSLDHGSIFKALVALWSNDYHPVSIEDEGPLNSITSETSIEELKRIYLRMLDTLKDQLWYNSDLCAHHLLVEALNQL